MVDTFLYTIPEAADALTCTRQHVYVLISSGLLRAVDIARPGSLRSRLRIRSEDLEDFLERSLTSLPRDGRANKEDPVQRETSAPGHAT